MFFFYYLYNIIYIPNILYKILDLFYVLLLNIYSYLLILYFFDFQNIKGKTMIFNTYIT